MLNHAGMVVCRFARPPLCPPRLQWSTSPSARLPRDSVPRDACRCNLLYAPVGSLVPDVTPAGVSTAHCPHCKRGGTTTRRIAAVAFAGLLSCWPQSMPADSSPLPDALARLSPYSPVSEMTSSVHTKPLGGAALYLPRLLLAAKPPPQMTRVLLVFLVHRPDPIPHIPPRRDSQNGISRTQAAKPPLNLTRHR